MVQIVWALTGLVCGWSANETPQQAARQIRRQLHRNPELSNRETQTQALLERELTKIGVQRIERIAKTGLRVVIDHGKPGPTIAFRADIDALPIQEDTGLAFSSQQPGVMHACGHDMHTAILFGTAQSLLARPDLAGRFVLLFQPAEEGPPSGESGGASLMVAEGALREPKPDVVFGLHLMPNLPLGQVATRAAGLMARADRFEITIHGKTSHGARPQLGVDALYVAAQVVTATQSLLSRETPPGIPAVVTFGQLNAGSRFNIIAGEARLTGTIRSLDRDVGQALPQNLERIVAGITQAHGASYTMNNELLAPVTFNDPTWLQRIRPLLNQKGIDLADAQPTMVAEDFGFYCESLPAVYFFLGTCPDGSLDCAGIHTAQFNPPESVIDRGIELWMALAESLSAED